MKKFLADSLIATFFVFLVLLGVREISQINIFNVFDPLGKALGDMDITDITFSKLRLKVPPVDENVTIVNIGNLSRAELAQQIRMIAALKPKVIGIDSFFDCKNCPGVIDSLCCPLAYDTLSNLLLGNAIAEAGNVVMVTKLLQSNKLVKKYGTDVVMFDSLEHTDSLIRANSFEGFANLETDAQDQEDLKTCRRFNPKMQMVDGSIELSFSAKVAMLFDSAKAAKFIARNKQSEVINFRGNVPDVYKASAEEFANRYTYLDWYQPFDTSSFLPSIIRDRIVLLGFMGADMDDTSWDDKFITPLNKQYAGKTRPDMYGVVVHANIISMILNEDYIDELAEWQQIAIAIFVCFLNVMLFIFITRKAPVLFDGLSLIVQLIQILICTFLMIYVLMWFNFKLNLTYTLAALALVGTCFELYNGIIREIIKYLKKSLTKREKPVLTTQD